MLYFMLVFVVNFMGSGVVNRACACVQLFG